MNKEYQKVLDNIKNMGDKDLYNERHLKWAETLQEAIEKANKYDDKETPKKPIKEIISDAYDCDDRNIDFEWERTKCPHCDDDLINEYENRDFEDYDYCPFCGGRLDWSDE